MPICHGEVRRQARARADLPQSRADLSATDANGANVRGRAELVTASASRAAGPLLMRLGSLAVGQRDPFDAPRRHAAQARVHPGLGTR